MTTDELIAIAKRGERIPRQPHSLHDHRACVECLHHKGFRTIVCNNKEDVCECPICGEQKVFQCNFNEGGF